MPTDEGWGPWTEWTPDGNNQLVRTRECLNENKESCNGSNVNVKIETIIEKKKDIPVDKGE